jgi:multidrug efflux system membrane fusion protein
MSKLKIPKDINPKSEIRNPKQIQMTKTQNSSFVFCMAALIAIGGAGCSKRSTAQPSERGPGGGGPAVAVILATAQQKTTTIEVASFGTVEPYANVDIKAQVTGILTGVHFTEGQMVKKGDPLLSIDPRQPQVALKAAQANLEGHEAQLKNAESEAARQTQLLQKGYASQDVYDKSIADVETLRAAVSADKAAIDNATLELDYCSIHSPIDGRTGSLHVHQGNLIKANDVSVVTVMQTDPIYVSFRVPEAYLPAIRKGMAAGSLDVRAAHPDANEAPVHGVLSLIENTVDVDARTIYLRATFANKDQRLWPGQYVDVVLTVAQEPNSVVVPSQAVQTGQSGQFIYVVKADRTVEARPVTVKRSTDIESVVEGVQAGEVIVTDGQLKLVPGSRVQTKETPKK